MSLPEEPSWLALVKPWTRRGGGVIAHSKIGPPFAAPRFGTSPRSSGRDGQGRFRLMCEVWPAGLGGHARRRCPLHEVGGRRHAAGPFLRSKVPRLQSARLYLSVEQKPYPGRAMAFALV